MTFIYPRYVYSTSASGAEHVNKLKQILQIKHNKVKSPNWQEADQLAISKRGRGVDLGSTTKQLQLVLRAGLELGTSGFQVQRNHSTTLPPIIL